MKNKELYSCLLGIFLFASCQNEEFPIAGTEEQRDRAIVFSITQDENTIGRTRAADNIHIGDSNFVSVDVEPIPDTMLNQKPQTRASLIDATSLTTMGVTGYYTKEGYFNPASSQANYLVNEKIWKDGTNWKYTNIKFWPSLANDRLSFFAYAPFFEPVAGGDAQTTSFDFTTGGTPTLTYTAFADPGRQYDLMVAVPILDNNKPINTTIIPLTFTMKHVLSSIGFTVTGNGEVFNKVKLEGIYRTGKLSMDVTSSINWSGLTDISNATTAPQAKTVGTITTGSAVQTVNTADGYIMVVPQVLTDNAELVIQMNDAEVKRVKLKPILGNWEAGKRYIYNLKFKNPDEVEVDLTGEDSNCFLLNPIADKNVTYKLPIKQVNRFWGNSTFTNAAPSNKIDATEGWRVGLLWQDKQNMVSKSTTTTETTIQLTKSTGIGVNDYFAIRIPKGATVKAGNFLVGISTDGSEPSLTETSTGVTNILWSWHIWITDYNPYGTKGTAAASGAGTVTSVPGGNLYTYANGSTGIGDKTVWGSKYSYILDRNIGALSATHQQTNKIGMMTYQFGRKDPFPGNVILYNISGTSVTYNTNANIYTRWNTTDPLTTLAWSIQHPLRLIAGHGNSSDGSTDSYNTGRWAYDFNGNTGCWHDPTVTDATGKSLFDPSPQRFRVPVNGTWSGMPSAATGYDITTGLNNPPYIYPIAYERDPTLGQIGASAQGDIFIWSATPLEQSGANYPGKGSAYYLYQGWYPLISGTANPAKATSRAVRSVQ